MLELKTVTLQRGGRILLDKVNATLYPGDKIGLVGRNGCGKSTLLGLLRGDLELDGGQLRWQGGLGNASDPDAIAYLEQQSPQGEQPAIELVKSGHRRIAMLQQQLLRAQQVEDWDRVALLHNQLYELQADKLTARAAKIMVGLGFCATQLANRVNSFSGGWRMRLNLAKLLVSNARLLLLDEPTNYLDLEAIWWLADWLQRFSGSVLVVSHDRDFLDRVVQRIWAIHQGHLEQYEGNYSAYRQQRAATIQQQQHAVHNQQLQRQSLRRFIDRFGAKATKAKQAQGRLKLLEKMEQLEPLQVDAPYHFDFRPSPVAGAPLFKMDRLDLGYRDTQLATKNDSNSDTNGVTKVLSAVNLALYPQDRVAILGVNGAGKSTLLRSIAGVLLPLTGQIWYDSKIRIGYFAQHQIDQFDLGLSGYQLIQQLEIVRTRARTASMPSSSTPATDAQIRSFLGGFGFSGETIFAPIGTLSGGERARFTLAWIIWQRPNLLILDEPTNHLDLEMREALARALQSYDGALLLVAHDPYLLSSSVDSFYELHHGQLHRWDGDLASYYTCVQQRKHAELADQRLENRPISDQAAVQVRSPQQNQTHSLCKHPKKSNPLALQRLEREIVALEQQLQQLNQQLQRSDLSAQLLYQKSQQLAQLRQQLSAKEERWYQLAG